MLGNKDYKVDIDFLNSLYEEERNVNFLHVKQKDFAQLYSSLKEFNKVVKTHYTTEDRLSELLIIIRKSVNKFFTSIEIYQHVIDSDLSILIQNLKEIKDKFPELFEMYCKPIIKNLINIKNLYSDSNFLIDLLKKHLDNNKNQCIIARQRSNARSIEGVPIVKPSDYLRLGIFFDESFFIGSPDFYDVRFSQLFLAKTTYFLTYDFFQNKIIHNNRFKALKEYEQIDTIYEKISIDKGYVGELASIDFERPKEDVFPTNEVILKHTKYSSTDNNAEKVLAKLVILNNNHYTLVPLDNDVRTIDKDRSTLVHKNVANLNIGDWILFRNNSNTDLVIDVANRLLGDNYKKYRSQQHKWKRRLKNAIDNNSLEKTIRVFRKKGIKNANSINIENWLSPNNIKIRENFNILLETLKFDEQTINEILEASEIIYSAHARAGKQITTDLIKQLDEDKTEEIIEYGYTTFTSPLLPGASFNLEEIKDIINEPIEVNKIDTMNIWRN